MDFTIFNQTELEEMFQAMIEHMPEETRQIAINEFGSVEQWRQHYLEVTSSEKMQKNYAKMVEWYGGKEEYLSVCKGCTCREHRHRRCLSDNLNNTESLFIFPQPPQTPLSYTLSTDE